MRRIKWNILGMCEVRWKGEGYVNTVNGNRFYYAGKDDVAQSGIGVLVTASMKQHTKSFLPVSARQINNYQIKWKIIKHQYNTNIRTESRQPRQRS
ncbi:unnamed protein product [Diabrotica balteata]|uniref:Uncharacterized protein n=1 Tax=Diabrotica balteata TaxID=107213 RepID=A0A9N9TBL8_DIABA|nr:unnamed protein product [Diabrotica balteata]